MLKINGVPGAWVKLHDSMVLMLAEISQTVAIVRANAAYILTLGSDGERYTGDFLDVEPRTQEAVEAKLVELGYIDPIEYVAHTLTRGENAQPKQ